MDPEQRRIFERIFLPESLAIVGIPRKFRGLGGQSFLMNLQRGDFPGRIYLVHPTEKEISGMQVYPSIAALPEAVDLAIVCVPAQSVPSLLEECSRRGVKNIHILSAGFKEMGTADGLRLEEEVRIQGIKGKLNIIGPNCMGLYVPKSRLLPWGQIPAQRGALAFLSQSGTLAQRMTEHAYFTGMGISKAVSFGNAAVLDSTDYLEYFAEDEETRVIGLYLESVRDGRRFLELARRINQTKPLVIWKGGETFPGAGAVASHTGTLSGEDRIWENGLRQAGITRVRSLEEITASALAFLNLPPPAGRRLFILGGGGGTSVYSADICTRVGLQVPSLKGETRDKITALVPAVGSSARNPVDAWSSFYDFDLNRQIIEEVLKDPDLDMIIISRLIPRTTYAMPEYRDITPEVIDYLQKKRPPKPLVVSIDGSGEDPSLAEEAARLRQCYCKAGIPAYPSLPLAAGALAHLAAYYERK